jgi:small conductance mechanosensitive channel
MGVELNELVASIVPLVILFGSRLIGAIVLWFIGRWLIRLSSRLLTGGLERQGLDSIVIGYVRSSVTVLLTVVLVVALLGFFGIETTSFAALLAAAGITIGTAWGGLLAHFAAGAFLVILRPFKSGDFVSAGGVTGTVTDVGMFVTTIDTPDRVRTIIGNNKIFSDTIQNFSANPLRRVEVTAQLAHGMDVTAAIARVKAAVAAIPNVAAVPAPEVEVLQFTPAGPVLTVRPLTHNSHYWQVTFDTNRAVAGILSGPGFLAAAVPTPTPEVPPDARS